MITQPHFDGEVSFRQLGYHVLPGALARSDIEALEREYVALNQWANRIVEHTALAGLSLAEYYRTSECGPIVVLEASERSQVCRFERLAGTSASIARVVSERLQPLVQKLVGEAVMLFKDKCNLKLPGGGAFPPHQDARAYRHFGANYHATAMVTLDAADKQNGCLEVAHRYREASARAVDTVETPLGPFPLFPDQAQDGAILDEASAAFDWRRLEMQPGQVVVFDSFLPHRSAVNASTRNRRALFFTFNLARDGSFYESYYRAKAQEYANPIFHVATPTLLGEASPQSPVRQIDQRGVSSS